MNLLLAALCVLLFSLTVPTTRLATQVFAPEVVALLRLLGAGVVCLVIIAGFDRWIPPQRIWGRLFVVAFGSVLGFTVCVSFAMRHTPAVHGAVAFAALPVGTAVYSSLRDGHNPGLAFWIYSVLGAAFTLSYFASGAGGVYPGDGLLAVAVVCGSLGYVEGARLSREYGGRRVMSWAIMLTLPVSLVVSWPMLSDVSLASPMQEPSAWMCVAYLGLVSQSTAMFLWNRVLATGVMARVAMMQMLQPFFSLLAAMLLLGERPGVGAWLVAALVVGCVAGAQRRRTHHALGETRSITDSGHRLTGQTFR